MQKKYLLPVGFYDLLGDEARVNQETIDKLLKEFYAAKYQLIKTPLIEFEDSFAVSCQLDNQSFKVTDSLSGKTMVFRSDITPQIARLMATKLKDVKMPIKLCYVGDVVKIENNNLYADRQLTQVGIELIGEDKNLDICTANIEVIELILKALKKIKLSGLSINFCYPQFLNSVFENLNVKNKEELKLAVATKNISKIKSLGEKLADDLITLAISNNDFKKITEAANNLKIKKEVIEKLHKWQKTISDIQKSHSEIEFSIDIFGDDELSYHEGIGFTIFAGGFSYPIARGGRYLINEKIPAIGGAIYMNNLRKILL